MGVWNGGLPVGAKSYLARWGASLAARIPTSVADQWGVREGSAIEIVPQGDRVILRKASCDLDAMLDEITPDSLHAEVDTGDPTGVEVW